MVCVHLRNLWLYFSAFSASLRLCLSSDADQRDKPTRVDRLGRDLECPAEPDLRGGLGLLFALLGLFGLLRLFALLFLLSQLGRELMPALVPLAAQAEGAAGRSLWRCGFLKKKLEQHQTAAVADAVIA